MKKTNYLRQLGEISAKAEKLINGIKKGVKIVLIDTTDEDDDINEAPIVTRVGKHGDFDEYAIVSVENKAGEIMLHLQGKGEASDEEIDLDFNDMGGYFAIDTENTCELADQISAYLTELEIGQ